MKNIVTLLFVLVALSQAMAGTAAVSIDTTTGAIINTQPSPLNIHLKSGQTLTIDSGANITNSGTATGFGGGGGVTTFNTRSGAVTLNAADVNAVLATSLGTVTVGAWNGTPITVPFGGTGQTSFTSGNILTGNGTSGFTSITPGTGVATALGNAVRGTGGLVAGTGLNLIGQPQTVSITAGSVFQFFGDSRLVGSGGGTSPVLFMSGEAQFAGFPMYVFAQVGASAGPAATNPSLLYQVTHGVVAYSEYENGALVTTGTANPTSLLATGSGTTYIYTDCGVNDLYGSKVPVLGSIYTYQNLSNFETYMSTAWTDLHAYSANVKVVAMTNSNALVCPQYMMTVWNNYISCSAAFLQASPTSANPDLIADIGTHIPTYSQGSSYQTTGDLASPDGIHPSIQVEKLEGYWMGDAVLQNRVVAEAIGANPGTVFTASQGATGAVGGLIASNAGLSAGGYGGNITAMGGYNGSHAGYMNVNAPQNGGTGTGNGGILDLSCGLNANGNGGSINGTVTSSGLGGSLNLSSSGTGTAGTIDVSTTGSNNGGYIQIGGNSSYAGGMIELNGSGNYFALCSGSTGDGHFDRIWMPGIDAVTQSQVVPILGNNNQGYTSTGIGILQVLAGQQKNLLGQLQAGTVLIQSIAAPSGSFTLATAGTAGSTTISYAAVATQADGTPSGDLTATITTANATLSSSNKVNLTLPALPTNASFWLVYRTAAGGSPATTGYIGNTSTTSFSDTGIATSTPPWTGPSSSTPASTNQTGGLTIGGAVTVSSATASTVAVFNSSKQLVSATAGNTFSGNNGTPTIVYGTGANSPTSTSIVGNGESGTITFTTGATPVAAGVLFTGTFASSFAYPNGSTLILSPGNASAALLSGATMLIQNGTTTTFVATTTGALTALTTYIINYQVKGY